MTEMLRKDVLILTCGGTIDKQYPQGPGAYAFEFGDEAVNKILHRIGTTIPYTSEKICAKDSQDMTDYDREVILKAVSERKQSLILITHGTDTLCDTAHYLVQAGIGQGKYFAGVGGKTVVLTGAFKPEAMKDSDADFNIGFAMGILQSSCPGVLVAMEGMVFDGAKVERNERGKFVEAR